MRATHVLHEGEQKLGSQALTVHIKCGHPFISAEDRGGAIPLHKLSLSTSVFLMRLMLYAIPDIDMQVSGSASVREQVAHKSL